MKYECTRPHPARLRRSAAYCQDCKLLLSNKSGGSQSSDCLLQTQWLIWACITYSEQSQFQYYRKFQIWTLRKIQFPFAESQIPDASLTILFRRLLPTECRDGSPAACENCAKRSSLSPNASFRSISRLGEDVCSHPACLAQRKRKSVWLFRPRSLSETIRRAKSFTQAGKSSLGLQNYGAHHQER